MKRWLVLGVAVLAAGGAVAWSWWSPAGRSMQRTGITEEQVAAQVQLKLAWNEVERVTREMGEARWPQSPMPWGSTGGAALSLWYRGYQEEVKLDDLAGHIQDPWSRARFRSDGELLRFCDRQLRHAQEGVATAVNWSPSDVAGQELRTRFIRAVGEYGEGWRSMLQATDARMTREQSRRALPPHRPRYR